MQHDTLQKTWVVWLLALTSCAFWASAFPCIKIGYSMLDISASDQASQILFAGYRFTLAGLMTIAITSLTTKRLARPRLSSLKYVATLSIFQTIGQYVLFYLSLAHLSGVEGTILNGSGSFIALLVAVYIFRQESMTGNKVFGCLIGFLGLVLVTLSGASGSASFLSGSFTWELVMILAATSSAFSSCFIRIFSKHENPAVLSGYQFLLGGIVMSLIGLAMGGQVHFQTLPEVLLLLYMGLISAVAYTLWSILLKHNPVSRIAVFGFMTQILAVFMSAIFLGETDRITPAVLISLALVCGGIYLVNRATKPTLHQ